MKTAISMLILFVALGCREATRDQEIARLEE
jgi:hypothetical protein